MRLSTKGRYGVRVMFDLALHYGNGPATLKDIAGRQEISQKYLWHLIPPLKNSGLIKSTRGSRGGYCLSRPPRQINLLMIVSALEGPLDLAECAGAPSVCKRASRCVAREVWAEVSAKMMEALESCTLEKMVEKQKGKARQVDYAI